MLGVRPTSAENYSTEGKSGMILQNIRAKEKSRTKCFLQIALKAHIEERNILVQMWNQNNKGHTEKF